MKAFCSRERFLDNSTLATGGLRLSAAHATTSLDITPRPSGEYACQTGTTAAIYGPLEGIAWASLDHLDGPQPVGRKTPNTWGLYDMLGNVR